MGEAGDVLSCVMAGGEGVVEERPGGAVLRVKNDTGEGSMAFCQVFDGVGLSFNDFRLDAYDSGFVAGPDMLCIDHCREGRIAQALGGFPVDLRALRDRFCRGGDPFIMHDAPGAEHIFCELYSVPDEIRATYFQLKVLELLLFLQVLDPGPVRERRPYFYRAQVEKVKAARDFMVSDLTVEHTIDELADRFDLPPTAFKTCFKGVYGLPPYAYLRTFRMERAAALLRETDLRGADIGLAVGYDSPSKFTAAFKAVIGQTPTVHRRDRARYVR